MRLLLFDEGSNLRAARASAEAPSGVGGAGAWPIRLYKAETNERVGFAARPDAALQPAAIADPRECTDQLEQTPAQTRGGESGQHRPGLRSLLVQLDSRARRPAALASASER